MTAHDVSGPVLVTGATGRQGGAVARALLAAGTPVRGLVRDLHSAAAENLERLGVSLVLGDLNDEPSLLTSSAGVRTVFSVQCPDTSDPGSDSERVQGSKLVQAARSTDVLHIVHTSVTGAGEYHRKAPGWEQGRWNTNYWESKAYTETLVRGAGFKYWTIVKPALFMESLLLYLVGDRLLTAYAPNAKLPLVAVEDIGTASVAAINDPERFNRVQLDLAGDVLTIGECAEVLSRAWGKKIKAPTLSSSEAIATGLAPSLVNGQEWCNEVGMPARPAQAAAMCLAMTDLKTWAGKNSPTSEPASTARSV